MTEPRTLTAGVMTRNRPTSLARCISSLALLGDRLAEIIVVDDASDRPVAAALAGVPPEVASKLRIIEMPCRCGPIAGRNAMMRAARTEFVLSLDDDAYILDAGDIDRALDAIVGERAVAAVACAQAEADGSPWPAGMQPAPSATTCDVPAYIGFAHVVRKSAFDAVGGYHELMYFYGEEKDLCIRLWNAGYRVRYVPDARVAHVPDAAGRSGVRYVRYVIRNDCLFSLHNEPFPLPLLSVPLRLARYFSMIRGHDDPGGFAWIVRDLATNLDGALRARQPVAWKTIRQWRRLRQRMPANPS